MTTSLGFGSSQFLRSLAKVPDRCEILLMRSFRSSPNFFRILPDVHRITKDYRYSPEVADVPQIVYKIRIMIQEIDFSEKRSSRIHLNISIVYVG